jgi:hypothetical protein
MTAIPFCLGRGTPWNHSAKGFNYDKFIVRWSRDGGEASQADVSQYISRTDGFFTPPRAGLIPGPRAPARVAHALTVAVLLFVRSERIGQAVRVYPSWMRAC